MFFLALFAFYVVLNACVSRSALLCEAPLLLHANITVAAVPLEERIGSPDAVVSFAAGWEGGGTRISISQPTICVLLVLEEEAPAAISSVRT